MAAVHLHQGREGVTGNMKRNTTIRRPRVLSMLHTVASLEATRDRLNPDLVPARNVDANLDDLRSWRKTSAALRAALPVKGGK